MSYNENHSKKEVVKFIETQLVWTKELCDVLCAVALQKANEMKLDISFAIADANGIPRTFQRFGEALVLSTILVPNKAYTSAITQTATKELAKVAVEGGLYLESIAQISGLPMLPVDFLFFIKEKWSGRLG